MGIADQAEAYLRSVEQTLSALPAGASDLANRIWADIARYGPPLPQSVSVPGIGSFELQPPPPPPPPIPEHWVDKYLDWVGERPVIVASAGLGAAALFGFGVYRFRRAQLTARSVRAAKAARGRRKVVVVLGADSSLGRQLVLDLEASGYIVIASVSDPSAVDEIEKRSRGYTRVLVLDPARPDQVPHFVRSLQATLAIRFPTSVAGDPYLSKSADAASAPYLYTLISLLPLATAAPAPLEVTRAAAYSEHLQRAHITPVSVIQALLPLYRQRRSRRFILFALPSKTLSLQTAFTAPDAAAAAATLAAANVLRRELPNVRIITAHVGDLQSFDEPVSAQWSVAHKEIYGPAFAAETGAGYHRFRFLTPLESASRSLIAAISPPTVILDVITIPRFPRTNIYIGARSVAFSVAGSLPAFLRDIILALPAVLAGLWNIVLPMPPPPRPGNLPRAATNRHGSQRELNRQQQRGGSRRMIESAPGALQMPEPATEAAIAAAMPGLPPATATVEQSHPHHDSDEDASETSSFSGTVSDADLDFESGEDSVATGGAGGTWVSLRDRRSTNATVVPGSS